MSSYEYIVPLLIVIFGAINIVRMTFFLVGSDLYSLRMAVCRKKMRLFTLPTFTVVVPAHNEEKTIRFALQSLAGARYDAEKLEIVVADDGSTDATPRIVQEFIFAHPSHSIRLISRPNAGKARALNHVIKNYASGELVMCLDADSTVGADALLKAARYFADPQVVAVASNVKIRPTGTFLNLVQQFEYLVCYQMKRAQTFFNIEYIVGGIGSTFRRSALARVGYYDTNTVTEDIDLTMKFLQLGNKENKVLYGSDIITYTESVLTLSGLIRQRFRWKWGRSQTFEKNRNLFFGTDTRHTKMLTWFYLPFAFFCDLAFFFEPFLITYILYVVIRFGDWMTLVSAFLVIGSYISFIVLVEDSIDWKEKARLVLIAPSMYLFFYVLSMVEYIALVRTYAQYPWVRQSIEQDSCGWQHVERAERERVRSV